VAIAVVEIVELVVELVVVVVVVVVVVPHHSAPALVIVMSLPRPIKTGTRR